MHDKCYAGIIWARAHYETQIVLASRLNNRMGNFSTAVQVVLYATLVPFAASKESEEKPGSREQTMVTISEVLRSATAWPKLVDGLDVIDDVFLIRQPLLSHRQMYSKEWGSKRTLGC